MTDVIFLGSKIPADGDYSHEIKMLAPWKKSYVQPRQHIEKQRHFANKGPSSKSYGFSSSHVWMWKLAHKEGWSTDAFELGCWGAEERMLLNWGVGEDSWESLGLQGDQTS